MKNQRFVCLTGVTVLGFVVAALLSCSKTDSSLVSRAASSAPAVSSENLPPVLSEGIALRVNASFCVGVKNDAGVVTSIKWNDSLVLGERVSVLGDSAKYTYEGDKAEYEFTPVLRDNGKEGFMFSSQLAPAGDLAVAIDGKAVLYKGPRNVDALSTILPEKTVLVAFPETERDGFVQFQAYDMERQRYYRDSFIKTQMLSFREDDVQSAILIHTAAALGPNETIRREALLGAARNDYPDSIFASEIRQLLGDVGKNVQASSLGALWINDHNVNVRDQPDEGSKVVGQLSLDTEVRISEETSESYTVNGQTARWYHITSPVEGWVFGAFLSQ
jgi:hypothetical protein